MVLIFNLYEQNDSIYGLLVLFLHLIAPVYLNKIKRAQSLTHCGAIKNCIPKSLKQQIIQVHKK